MTEILGVVQEDILNALTGKVCAVPDGLTSWNEPLFVPELIHPGPPSQIWPLHGLMLSPQRWPEGTLPLHQIVAGVPPESLPDTKPWGPVVFRPSTSNPIILCRWWNASIHAGGTDPKGVQCPDGSLQPGWNTHKRGEEGKDVLPTLYLHRVTLHGILRPIDYGREDDLLVETSPMFLISWMWCRPSGGVTVKSPSGPT